MNKEKETGTYYTPKELIHFMMDYLIKEGQDFSEVLEPSAGDGRFLPFLLQKSEHIDAIEICQEKVEQIKQRYQGKGVTIEKINFLNYAIDSKKKYSLIIGNPPYINLKNMHSTDIDLAKDLCESEQLSKSIMKNMWLAFVVGAVKLLENKGSIFFVLPMEFLQVQYAEKLRIYLEQKFNTIHIISFEEPVFPHIEQDVCLVYLANKNKCFPYVLYEIYENTNNVTPISSNIIKKNKPLKKWSNAILKDEDISLLNSASSQYMKISDLGNVFPGIVTGGDKYFILTKKDVEEYGCAEYTVPIIQKSYFVEKGTIDIDNSVMKNIQQNNYPSFLLNLADEKEISKLPVQLQMYLEQIGREKTNGIELRKRFKCSNRQPWYGVPVVNPGDIIFFRRYDMYPKVYINSANIYTTDVGYHIQLKKGIDVESFYFCFFNSMTLAECEFNGRYYGGGVEELVPSEFKNLSIPYRKINQDDIRTFKALFSECEQIKDIVDFVDSKTIASDFNKKEVDNFKNIRLKLMKRRKV